MGSTDSSKTDDEPRASFEKVQRLITASHVTEGAGFKVRRPFGEGETVEHIGGAFLMLDHLRNVYKPGEAIGAPAHPHRGFCTLTYLLSGGMEHKDSGSGRSGRLSPGWMQFMVAGRGVVHSELPTAEALEKGGLFEGFQLWLNLPAREKMAKPRYHDVSPEEIPTIVLDGGCTSDGRHSYDGAAADTVNDKYLERLSERLSDSLSVAGETASARSAKSSKRQPSSVKVLVGSYGGLKSPVETHTPMTILDVTLRPHQPVDADAAASAAMLEVPVPAGHACAAYVYRGQGLFGPPAKAQSASEGQCFLLSTSSDAFDSGADAVIVRAVSDGSSSSCSTGVSFLLFYGECVGDPIARRGPFVMCTEKQLMHAAEDYRAGKMGRIDNAAGVDGNIAKSSLIGSSKKGSAKQAARNVKEGTTDIDGKRHGGRSKKGRRRGDSTSSEAFPGKQI